MVYVVEIRCFLVYVVLQQEYLHCISPSYWPIPSIEDYLFNILGLQPLSQTKIDF